MTGTNPIAKWIRTLFTSQDPTTYKSAIDANFTVAQRVIPLFAPRQADTPNMTVVLEAGVLPGASAPTEVALQTTPTFTAPVSNPRIDRIVISNKTGALSVIAGTEAASPTPPNIPVGYIPIAQVSLLTTTTSILNSNISDERVFPLLPASTSPTGSTLISAGTTAQRDLPSGIIGIRYNTSLNSFEGFNGVSWGSIGGGAAGAGVDHFVNENDQVMLSSYVLGGNSQAALGLASAVFANGSATITAANSFVVGQRMFFTATGALPTNFSTLTGYYVVAATPTAFQVSATSGGTAITAGSAGSGSVTVSAGLLKNGQIAGPWSAATGQTFTIPGGAKCVIL